VAYSPNDQWIASGGFDGRATLWDAKSGHRLIVFAGHNGAINAVSFSPDSQRIVTGSDDHTARVWQTESGKETATLKGHNGRIYAVAFSPDGQWIVTGSDDQTAKVWRADSGVEVLTLPTQPANASRSDKGPPTMDVNLQRLVRYFAAAGQTPGRTNSSASFNPPVKGADLSKMPATPDAARSHSK